MVLTTNIGVRLRLFSTTKFYCKADHQVKIDKQWPKTFYKLETFIA